MNNPTSTSDGGFTISSLIFYFALAFIFFFLGKNFDKIK